MMLRTRFAATSLIGLILVLYPFVTYFALTHDRLTLAGLSLIALAALRLALSRGSRPRVTIPAELMAAAAIAPAVLAVSTGEPDALLFYPVCVNAMLLVLFASSLLRPPPIIERLARLRTPDLPPSGVAWTRKVTIVWCLFFIVNGALAAATALSGDVEIWTLYNGMIAYIAMGILLTGEFLARRIVMRRGTP